MTKLEEEIQKFRFKMPVEIRWSDMDEMRHVNNAVYLTYFEQARVYYFTEACDWDWQTIGVILAKATIEFRQPLLFANPAFIYMRVSRLGGKSFEIQYLITTVVKGIEEMATTGSTVMVMYDYPTSTSIPMPDFLREKIRDYETVKP